ncbi:YceD family protein [Ichthyobacterium seriolicida]|uniref:DNA-binding protein n=1 Tax=Ichthyobacterium seriolicida TaxID=242600 RepID=A0A1J1ECI0_9FLAO|nr:DUF177 domain-containing protein [Ichthyobacterium seriolicida]BAV95216.1 DNA-binding protein [Ichthyobacterium seriolicida]
MKRLDHSCVIRLVNLNLNDSVYIFDLNESFLEFKGYVGDISKMNVRVEVCVKKHVNTVKMYINLKGELGVPCDISQEHFLLPVQNDMEFLIKFGDAFNDDYQDMIVVPHNVHALDISQYIYELIVLSLPMKRVHPKIKNYTEDFYSSQEDFESKKVEITDPRWDKLKRILN